MQKIYHLSSCSTCKRIIDELNPAENTVYQDIKTEKITPDQIDEMAKITGSYESLFSRTAMKYKSMGLKDKSLSEQDYRNLILEEYTFLKRPVVLVDKHIFVGNAPKTVAVAKEAIK